MPTEIRGVGSQPVGQSQTERKTRATGDTPARATAGTDAVELTATASRLQALETQLSELPVVDRDRVAKLRADIAEAKFNPDSEKVAEKLIEMEKAFRALAVGE